MATPRRQTHATFLALFTVALLCPAPALWAHDDQANPPDWKAAAQQQMALGKYELAFTDLLHALSQNQTDPELLKLAGDTRNMCTAADPENFRKAIAYYDLALKSNPAYLPAHRALLVQYQDGLNHAIKLADRQVWAKNVQKAAQDLLAVDADDPAALKAAALMPLELYLSGASTDPAAIDDAVFRCQSLAAANLADSDFPFYMARTRIIQGSDAAAKHDPQEADRRSGQATQIMDEAVQGQDQNAPMIYRAALVDFEVAATSALAAATPAQRTDLLRTELAQLKKAHDLLKPDDPMYVEINLTYALNIRHDPDLGIADRLKQTEDVYHEVLAKQPDSLAVRLSLADLVARSGRRQEAIDIVSQTSPTTQPKTGMDGVLASQQEDTRLIFITKLQIEQTETLEPGAARDALLTHIYDNLQTIQTDRNNPGLADNPEVLFIRGRLELIQGLSSEGIQTLNRALQQNQATHGPVADRVDIMYHLADAEIAAGQSAQAQALAENIVKVKPDYYFGQRLLAQLLIHNHDVAGAEPHIQALEAMPGTAEDPSVVILRLSTCDPTKDQNKIRAALAKLPETTPQQCVTKAQAASGCHAFDIAERLLLPYCGPDNPDLRAMTLITQAYTAENKKDQAISLVDAALATHPQDLGLQALRAQLSRSGDTPIFPPPP